MKFKLSKLLMESFKPSYFKLVDQSHLHAGHFENTTGIGTHFDVTLVSKQFEMVSKVNRHRQVNAICKDLFSEGLHALALHIFDEEEWSKKNG